MLAQAILDKLGRSQINKQKRCEVARRLVEKKTWFIRAGGEERGQQKVKMTQMCYINVWNYQKKIIL